MDIKKSLTFLKNKIDSFECGRIIGGKPVKGLEALRFWLRNNYKTNPGTTANYVSRELTDLYEKLRHNEDGHIFNTDHFCFMKDSAVFYSILKALNITFEELMEPHKHNFHPQTSYELLHQDNEDLKTQIYELTNVVRLGFNKTERSVFEEKQKEFTNMIGFMKIFSDWKKDISTTEPSKTKELVENQRLIFTIAITNISGQIISLNTIKNLTSQDIPMEYLQLQYFKAVQESKTSEIAKIFRELKATQNTKYYDDLAEKISRIITKDTQTTHTIISSYSNITNTDNGNYVLYSCNVCLFDFINRMTIIFTNAFSHNVEYQSALKLKKTKKKAYDLLQYAMISDSLTWGDFFYNTFEQTSIKNSFELHEENIAKFQSFLKETGSKLRQLSVYLANIGERAYSDLVVNEIRTLLDEYISILIQVIYKNFWNLNDEAESRINTFLDDLNQHTIIISHHMGELTDGND